MKLVCDTIKILQKNPKRNTKPEWEIRLESQVRKLQQTKVLRKENHKKVCWDEKTKNKTSENSEIKLENISQKILVKEGN